MTLHRVLTGLGALLLFVGPAAGGQGSTINSAQAAAFIGTWVFDMTEPAELVGTSETVRVWEENGVVAASVQVAKFPPNDVTGILKDRDLLILSTTLRENGQPIWVVISLKLEGETMMLAQMMEPSRVIKRGTGKKRVD